MSKKGGSVIDNLGMGAGLVGVFGSTRAILVHPTILVYFVKLVAY